LLHKSWPWHFRSDVSFSYDMSSVSFTLFSFAVSFLEFASGWYALTFCWQLWSRRFILLWHAWAVFRSSTLFSLRCPSSILPVDHTRWHFAGSSGAVFNSPVDDTRWRFADSSGAVFDSSHQAMRKSEHSDEHLWIDVASASLRSLSGFALIVAAMNVSLHP
jgi:hypothetical protein